MSARGRRSHPNLRRYLALPPGRARGGPAGAPKAALVSVDSADPPEADADALIAAFRVRAHSEARRRQRQSPTREAAAHWGFVAKIIARRTGDEPRVEPSTRVAMDADLTTDRVSPGRSPGLFSEVRQLEELERILHVKPRQFRLQFFAVAGNHGPAIVAEADIPAADASDAIRAAAEAPLPPRAIGVRVLDREGREIFEQLKADRR